MIKLTQKGSWFFIRSNAFTSPTDFGHLFKIYFSMWRKDWILVSSLFIYLFTFILDAERAKISSTTGTTGTSTGTDTTGLTSDFANWSEWSGCSTTCSDGTRSRTRTCPGPYQCVGATNCDKLGQRSSASTTSMVRS